ncbi:MAG: Hpt domain-containing protein [Pseudobacteriovorax sp.]|nr:Hpt domain-containing protein [Pseudobacteriovorax sp.]
MIRKVFYFLSLWILASSIFDSSLIANPDSSKIPMIRINSDGVVKLPKYWKALPKHVESLNESHYNSLEFSKITLASLQYVPLKTGPSEKSWVIRLDLDKDRRLAFYTPGIAASTKIELQNSLGRQTIYKTDHYDQYQTKADRIQNEDLIIPLTLVTGTNYLFIHSQFYNFGSQSRFTNIGIESRGEIGPQSYFLKETRAGDSQVQVPLGVIICLAVYSFLIYVSRRGADRESLYLFLVNLFFSLKEICSQGILLNFLDSSFMTQVFASGIYTLPMLSYFSMVLAVEYSVTHKFLRGLKYVSACCFVLTAFFAIGPFFLPFVSFGLHDYATSGVICSMVLFFFALLPFTFYQAIRKKRPDTYYLALGLFFLGLGNILDFSNVLFGMDWPWFSLWGALVFSLILAKNNSRKFANTYARSEKLNRELKESNLEVAELNANLEVKVEERTAEIKSLLTHIPQGILSIGANGVIDSSYSQQLEELLGHNQIAGNSFKETILDKSDLSADIADQLWQSILVALGEDVLGFEMNEDKLIHEFGYHRGDDLLHLRLTWNPKVDASDCVDHIMVTMLDVTDEWHANHKLASKMEESELIAQLVEAGVKKTTQFFGSANNLLNENIDLVQSGDTSSETLKILFVNAHTLKGGARTLQFLQLAETLHRTEVKYAEMLQGYDGYTIDELKQDLESVKRSLSKLIDINERVLGRTADYSKVSIEREFLEECFFTLRNLDGNEAIPKDLRTMIANNADNMLAIIFSPLKDLLLEITEQSDKIAKDLGKESPKIDLDCPKLLINHEQDTVIRNCMIHLLRNSLDHGIEKKDFRVKNGKDPVGTISLRVMTLGRHLQITLFDDGRSLALDTLKQQGIEKGDYF